MEKINLPKKKLPQAFIVDANNNIVAELEKIEFDNTGNILKKFETNLTSRRYGDFSQFINNDLNEEKKKWLSGLKIILPKVELKIDMLEKEDNPFFNLNSSGKLELKKDVLIKEIIK